MAAVTVSGLSTGIDYDSLISQLVKVERIPLNRMENKKTGFEQKQAAYSDVSSKFEALESAAQALKLSTSFQDKEATVSDETVFTASPTSTATTGVYSVTVENLALQHKFISGAGLAADDSTVASGSGSFTFKVGDSGTEYTVSVTSSTTLEELKDEINLTEADVNAVIVNEGIGATPYRLILGGTDTGVDNKIIVTQDDTNLSFDVNDTTLTSANHLQKPQDAQIDMDGLTVYRSSNTVTDLIPGASLSLHKADADTVVTLEVGRDEDAIVEKVTALVDAYNAVISYIDSRDNYDTEKNTGEPLWGEGTVRSLVRQLGNIASAGVTGLPSDMKILAQIGVETDRDGTLNLNSGTLRDAMDEDFDKVMNLFVLGDGTEGVAEKFYQLAHNATRTGDGDLAIRTDGIAKRIRDLESEIEFQVGLLERYQVRLEARFAALESTVTSMQNQNQLFLPSS